MVCHHQSLGVTTVLIWAMLCRLVQLIQDLRVCGSKTLPPSLCKNKEMAASPFFLLFFMFLCIFLFCFLCNSVLLFMRGLSQCKGLLCKNVTTAHAFCFSLSFKEIGSNVLAFPHWFCSFCLSFSHMTVKYILIVQWGGEHLSYSRHSLHFIGIMSAIFSMGAGGHAQGWKSARLVSGMQVPEEQSFLKKKKIPVPGPAKGRAVRHGCI